MEVAATEIVTTATDKQTNNDPREKEGSLLQKGKEQLPKSPRKRSALSSEPSGNQLTKSETKVRNKRQKQAEVHRSVLTVTKKGFLRSLEVVSSSDERERRRERQRRAFLFAG